MKILIIDTATENCSAALYMDGQISDQEQESPREHSQRLLPMVDGLLAEAGITLADLDAIGFGRGPGSFTGIRIGTSMMQGLALGAELPVLPISNLAAMAQAAIAEGATEVVAAIDARMGEVYFGQYRAENGLAVLVGEELVIGPDDLLAQWQLGDAVVAVGTGFETYPQLAEDARITVASHLRLPSAKLMIPLAVDAFNRGEAMPVDEVEPVYLRNNVAWKKLPGRE